MDVVGGLQLGQWLPALLAGAGGAALGFLADRLAARWPEHEPDEAGRSFDWRTVVVVVSGALFFAGLVLRWGEPRDLLILAVFGAALVVLLATDLDQRLLPDVITLPLIAMAAVVLLLGWSPLLAGKQLALVSGLAAGVGAPLFLVVTDWLLRGEVGGGDVKLAASIGLLAGVVNMISGFLVASIGFSLVVLALMASRRIGRKTPVPFGPVLIYGAFAAMLIA